jgi:hypothetical protein
VRLIIADTGPINYLVPIGSIDLLPVLFDKVILPSAVQAELIDPDAPLRSGTGLPILQPGFKFRKLQGVNSAKRLRRGSMKGRRPQSPRRWTISRRRREMVKPSSRLIERTLNEITAGLEGTPLALPLISGKLDAANPDIEKLSFCWVQAWSSGWREV